MPTNYLSAIAIVVTVIFNIGLATAGITDKVQCVVEKGAVQAAAAAAAWR